MSNLYIAGHAILPEVIDEELGSVIGASVEEGLRIIQAKADRWEAFRLALYEYESELNRLRQQNHEAAERRDREMAKLQSTVDLYRNAYKRARELVRGSFVDWTSDPPSKKPDGWWKYTSQVNRDIIAAAVLDAWRQNNE